MPDFHDPYRFIVRKMEYYWSGMEEFSNTMTYIIGNYAVLSREDIIPDYVTTTSIKSSRFADFDCFLKTAISMLYLKNKERKDMITRFLSD